MHSVPSIINGDVIAIGDLYLNKIGFYPFGVVLAWTIKISHILAAICLIINRYLKVSCSITIMILIMGIILVHFKEGWYVVGGGRNGVEFNFLLIFVLIHIMYSNKTVKSM